MRTLALDAWDRMDAAPFAGHLGPLPPPPAPSGRLEESRGVLLVAVGTLLSAFLLSRLPGADPADDAASGDGLLVELGHDGAAASGTPEPVDDRLEAPVPSSRGPGRDTAAAHTAPERNGLTQGSRRPQDAAIPRETAPVRSFRIGDQVPGRQPAPLGTVGGTGDGAQGEAPRTATGRVRTDGGIGGVLAGGRGPGVRPEGDEASTGGPPQTGVVRRISTADLWAAAKTARATGSSGGLSAADAVASSARTILRNPVTAGEGARRAGWLVQTSGDRTCAIAESDRTVVCARREGDRLRALVGGPRASAYATTEAALRLLASLVRP